MNTKAFLMILVLVLVLGGSIGGAFVGGIALGKTQSDDPVASGLAVTGGTDSQFSQGGLGLPQRDQLRQGIQSGNLSQQDLEQLRQRFASGDLSQQDLQQLREGFRSGEFGQQGLGQAFGLLIVHLPLLVKGRDHCCEEPTYLCHCGTSG